MGSLRADLLKKELEIFTFEDLLNHFPHRHIDKTSVSLISHINPATDYIQVAGILTDLTLVGSGKGKRLVGYLDDNSGIAELVWFQGISWIQKNLVVGSKYLVFGKTGFYNSKPQIVHPEIELFTPTKAEGKTFLEPVYPATEKLKARGLNGRQLAKFTYTLLQHMPKDIITENLPDDILKRLQLVDRYSAFCNIHFPETVQQYEAALKRLKFEELFIAQVRLNLVRIQRNKNSTGVKFEKVGEQFNEFYNHHLPFTLTNAQKRVIKEIRTDVGSGHQMNRLLQGDVGSGKTMVALLAMLLAMDNGYQSCLMAPTEILAQQHYNSLKELLQSMQVNIVLLTGSTKSAARKKILQG